MILIKLTSISNSLLTKIYIFILALSIYSLWPLYDYSDSMPIRLIKYVDYQKIELCESCIKMVGRENFGLSVAWEYWSRPRKRSSVADSINATGYPIIS